MTDFVSRTSTHLGTDRIFTSPTAQALYDNPIAMFQGAAGAQRLLANAYGEGHAVPLFKTDLSAGAAVATIDFTGLGATYESYLIEIVGLRPATNSTSLLVQVSQAGSFQSGASDYQYDYRAYTSGADAIAIARSSNATFMLIGGGGGTLPLINTDVQNLRASIMFGMVSHTAKYKTFRSWGTYWQDGGNLAQFFAAGAFKGDADPIDGVRLSMATGNIENSGYAELYGMIGGTKT